MVETAPSQLDEAEGNTDPTLIARPSTSTVAMSEAAALTLGFSL